MSLHLRRAHRRILTRWICAATVGAATLTVASPVDADDFLSFLNSANAFQAEQIVPGEATLMAPAMDEAANAAADDVKPEEAAESDETESSDEEESEDELTLEELAKKLEELDETIADYEKSLEKVEKLAGNKSIVVSGSSKSTMKVSGRVHADAWGFDTDDSIDALNGSTDPLNRLGFRRLRFGVKGNIKDNMLYKIEMEFAGNNAQFRDAYLGWTDLPILQKVLLGNQKRPYGLDHLNSSRFNVFIERPFIIEALNEDARRFGLQSYGVSDDQAWNWRYGVMNQENIQQSGNYSGDNLQLQLAGRLANTIWYDETSNGRGYAHWAVSGTHADTSSDPDEAVNFFRTRPEARTDGDRWIETEAIQGMDYYNLIGLESVVNFGALQIVGEYQSTWVERDGFEDVRFDGGYVYASYFLTGEHMPWDRKSGTLGRPVPFENFWLINRSRGGRAAGWGAFQLAARYSVADFNDGAVNGVAGNPIRGGDAKALTIGMNWYWNSNARMQFNYINGRIEDAFGDGVAPDDGATSTTGSYNITGARFMVDF